MIKSDSTKEITKALLGFHRSMNVIAKTGKNPYFNSTYAELPVILKEIKIPLLENGLVIVQTPETENLLTTVLLHTSGEFIQSTMNINPVLELYKEKNRSGEVVWRGDAYISPQAAGSAITYARRHAISAILSLNENDDDGNNGSGKEVPPQKKPTLAKKAFDQAIARIDKGERDVIKKLKETFELSAEQLVILNKK